MQIDGVPISLEERATLEQSQAYAIAMVVRLRLHLRCREELCPCVADHLRAAGDLRGLCPRGRRNWRTTVGKKQIDVAI